MKTAFISVFVNTIRLSTDRLIASAHALILSADTIKKLTGGRSVLLPSNAAFFVKAR